MNKHNSRIRDLNDSFRRSGGASGVVLMTQGIQSLGPDEVANICLKVSKFDAFAEENDPYGQHDFGAFDHADNRIFWKIDCYDQSMQFGSPDPADPSLTKRVLTIMLAEEY